MKKISGKSVKLISSGDLTLGTCEFGRADFEISHAKIDGRFPESGYVQNTEVDEIYYVKSGSGKLCLKSAGGGLKI